MRVVYSPGHRSHNLTTAAWVGVQIPSDEVPERIEIVVRTLVERGHELVEAVTHDDVILHLVHDPELVRYMSTAVKEWVEAGIPDEVEQPNVTAYAFPTAAFLGGLPLRMPKSRAALAGVWATDTMTPIGEGTFEAARAAVDMAQTAAELVLNGEPAAYATCRPPGHHAGRGFFGGSCYLNNAAVAAETLRQGGFDEVAILDLDAHHGNGTQEIFYDRGDVFYGSVHVDPAEGWFPHFVGFSEEVGQNDGEGANLNVPIGPGEGDQTWLNGVETIIEAIGSFDPAAIVVSLGVDAGASDENSPLLVTAEGYRQAGGLVAELKRPTVLVQEGGYDLETIGEMVAATLEGIEG